MRTAEHNARIGAALRARGVGQTPTKVCPRCGEDKARSEYRTRPTGWTCSYCRPCERAYAVERQAAYRARTPHLDAQRAQTNREVQLRRKYGMTLADYEALVEQQGGVCAACQQPPTRDRANLDVDHCHDTGQVRGLLCSHCNRALGLLGDDPVRLRALAAYAESHRG